MTYGTSLGAEKLLLGRLYGMRYVTLYDKITHGHVTPIDPRSFREFQAETRGDSDSIHLSVANPPPPGYGKRPHAGKTMSRKSAQRYGGHMQNIPHAFVITIVLTRYLNARST